MYPSNPVLANTGPPDFCNQKIFFHGPTKRWIMVLKAGNRVILYGAMTVPTEVDLIRTEDG